MAKTFRTSCVARIRVISVPLFVFGNPEFWICYENGSPYSSLRGDDVAIWGGVTSSNHVCGDIFMFYGARCKRAWPIVSDFGFPLHAVQGLSLNVLCFGVLSLFGV